MLHVYGNEGSIPSLHTFYQLIKLKFGGIFIFEVYADEVFVGNKFLGIGCLFVPIEKKMELINALIDLRCLGKGEWQWDYNKCPFNEKCKDRNNNRYHTLNDCAIHYQDLTSSSSRAFKDISNRWVNFILSNNIENKGLIFFQILFVNLNNLNEDYFGDESIRENIYNRFFRMTILKGSRYFFGNHSIKKIKKIFHHKGESHELHPYFSWHTGYRLNIDEDDFNVLDEEITFLNGDHKDYYNSKEENLIFESHLVQFMDLIMGITTRNLFDLSKDPEKIKLASDKTVD